MMLPWPFLSLGCCLPGSETVKLIFNDHMKTITYEQYSGLFMCCATKVTFSYSDVANVYVKLVPNLRINKQSAYKVVLYLEDGTHYLLAGAKLYGSADREARKWHHFMFGRHNPNYSTPATLLLPTNLEYELS